MELLIRVERAQPPTGTVQVLQEDEPIVSATDEVLAFVGWLGLLRALAELMHTAAEPAGG